MLRSLKLKFIFSLMMGLVFASCGIDSKPHYGDKDFGQSDSMETGKLPVANDPTESAPESPDAPPEREPEQEPEAPANAVLSHFSFGGYFNLNTVRRVLKGDDQLNAEISQGGFLDSMLSKLLGFVIGDGSQENLTIVIQQNGHERNRVTQEAETAGGDNISNFRGSESQSGTQVIDWSLNRTAQEILCPTPFICVERMVWIPQQGETMTYCYRDHSTKKPMVIPYGPNSHFGGDAFEAALGDGLTSKPFEVVTHPGNVACDAEGIETRNVQLVIYKLSTGNLAEQRNQGFLKRAIHRGLRADTEIVIQFSLYDLNTQEPYIPKSGLFIDQVTRLNSKMRFFMNSAEHVMVKIERTVQSPLKLEGSQIADTIREMYGDIAAYLVALIFPKDNDTVGVQLTYSFEFCKHLGVIQNPFDHCTGK